MAYHGYPRATADMDIGIAVDPKGTAKKVMATLKSFGFDVPELSHELFLKEDRIIRLGMPPIRIVIMTSISEVSFGECYSKRVHD